MMPGFPRSSADVPWHAPLRELVDHYQQHVSKLIDSRHQIGDVLPAEQLRAHALAAVALQHTLSDRSTWSTWVNVRAALAHGVPIGALAAALELDVDDVRQGLTRWSAGQLQHNLITRAEYDATLDLLTPATPRRPPEADRIDTAAQLLHERRHPMGSAPTCGPCRAEASR